MRETAADLQSQVNRKDILRIEGTAALRLFIVKAAVP